MPIRPIWRTSKGQNGVGAFILQCKRLEFSYCDWAGSSRGMVAFLQHHLGPFAQANPQVEMVVTKRPHKHPVIRGEYINGRDKVVCVRNLEPDAIRRVGEQLRNASGLKLKRHKRQVESMNLSTRGIWSPFHDTQHRI